MRNRKSFFKNVVYIILFLLAVVFLAPILIIIMNSFKGNFFISDAPFALPNTETFAGFANYIKGFTQSDFARA